MKKIFFIFIVLCASTACFSQLPYDVKSIPDSLQNGASAVKRYENISFEVSDIDGATLNVHQVITVLNKQGNSFLEFDESTSKYEILEEAEIKVYNSLGLQVGKYRKRDFVKYASGDGLIEDGMQYYFKVPSSDYPLTVEYNYSLRFNGTLFYPRYELASSEESVQASVFSAKVPVSLGLRYKNQKTSIKPQTSDDGKTITYTWSVNNLLPIMREVGGPKYKFSYPAVLLAPNSFGFYNRKGEMTSWKSFGAWEESLLTGLEILPEERKAFFMSLTKDAGTEREKAKRLYDYLHKNFRYVSIQLGIGGVKPFPAKFTDEKKYGDCKGLSFYMYSALKSIGIKSYVALINADYNSEPVDPAFPMNGFNHVILCIPQPTDSIWLECTSKETEFNNLSAFTENRNALLITEYGGVLVPTPESRASANTFTAFSTINLQEDGTGSTTTKFFSKGEYRALFNELDKRKKDEQKGFIVNYLGFRQPDEFQLMNKSFDDECKTDLQLSIEKIPQFSAGNKMFLSPRIYSYFAEKLPSSENRKLDYYFETPFEKTDTTIYQLPTNYLVDALPKPASRKCTYATYAADYTYNKDKNQLISTARLVLYKNRIPADKYADVKSFFDQINGDEGQKIVIKKN